MFPWLAGAARLAPDRLSYLILVHLVIVLPKDDIRRAENTQAHKCKDWARLVWH